jgi:hypothetical protein
MAFFSLFIALVVLLVLIIESQLRVWAVRIVKREHLKRK